MNRLRNGTFLLIGRAKAVVAHPVFPVLTLVGNGVIFLAAGLLYRFEGGLNPKVHSYLDTLWWAFATAATVGYGDISPVSPAGKILGILMMVFGTALFSSFIALFAATLIAPEFTQVEKRLEKDEESLETTLKSLQEQVEKLRKRL